MRRVIWAAVLWAAAPALVWAQGPLNPTWTRNSQGSATTVIDVSCATTDDTAFLSATQTTDARAITFCNLSATTAEWVLICPAATCAWADFDGIPLLPMIDEGTCVTLRDGVNATTWSCDAQTGAAEVSALIEK